MTYTPHQLRSALYEEHKFFAHDDDSLMHPDDYLQHIAPMLLDELIAETGCDDTYDLQLFMQDWLPA
jgi:hypothetical protein